MLDAQTFTRLLLSDTRFVYSRCALFGFRGEDLVDIVSEAWTEVWADRDKWPLGGPDKELAYLRKHVESTAKDKRRALTNKMRGAPTLPLQRADGVDRAETKAGGAFRIPAQQEEEIDRVMIERAIRIVAATLAPDLEKIVLAKLRDRNLTNDKDANQRAMREFRRALAIPADYPRRAGVTDAADHLIRAAKNIQLGIPVQPPKFDISEEMTCVTELQMNSLASAAATSEGPRRSGEQEPSQSKSPWSATAAAIVTSRSCERRPTTRSQRPPSASARSRRPAPSASTTQATPRTTVARPPETTAVSRRPRTFGEESSMSGSRG